MKSTTNAYRLKRLALAHTHPAKLLAVFSGLSSADMSSARLSRMSEIHILEPDRAKKIPEGFCEFTLWVLSLMRIAA
jgi:hypothetical protein